MSCGCTVMKYAGIPMVPSRPSCDLLTAAKDARNVLDCLPNDLSECTSIYNCINNLDSAIQAADIECQLIKTQS
jgi:hypothetical protein